MSPAIGSSTRHSSPANIGAGRRGARMIAWFTDEEHLLDAVRAARAAGLVVDDVYTPYPVHGMDEAMGLRASRLTWVCFGAAMIGLASAFALQGWASAGSWPLNVGGKPMWSIPAFVPVAFELTVLFAGLITVAALLIRARLRPRLSGRAGLAIGGVTNDRFALVLDAGQRFDPGAARALVARHHAVETRILEEAP